MTFSWTPHRFSGGALALDVANSVVLRFDAARRIDRYADPVALESFAAAATRILRRQGPVRRRSSRSRRKTEPVFSISGSNRPAFSRRGTRACHPASIWPICWTRHRTVIRAASAKATRTPLDAAAARSALMLATFSEPERMKICPNCQWLFLDRSRTAAEPGATWRSAATAPRRTATISARRRR